METNDRIESEVALVIETNGTIAGPKLLTMMQTIKRSIVSGAL
jgi:hypothetical protein